MPVFHVFLLTLTSLSLNSSVVLTNKHTVLIVLSAPSALHMTSSTFLF